MRTFFAQKLFALIVILFAVKVTGQTFYISPSGNDNATGTSSGNAWKSISKLNNTTLAPGTTVLFEGGQSFNGSIYLDQNDANSSSVPVIISSYGTGKALISSGNDKGFFAYNTKGIHVSNLVFEGSSMATNTSDGVSFYTDLPGNVKLANIKCENLEIKNYGKTGLFISSYNLNTGFKNVLINNVEVHDVKETGILTSAFTSQTHTGWAHENIVIRNSQTYNIPGYADASSHRGSGIILSGVDGALIEKSTAHHTGSANTHCGGPGGIWAYDCNNLIIQYCESYKNSSGSGCDGLGFDLDGGITNSILQYNYSHDNDGAGYLLGQYDNARNWNNNTVRYNISENDGRTNAGGITLFKGVNTTMNNCKIYHNTVFTSSSASNPLVSAFSIINWNTGITGVEVYNNIFVTTGGARLVNIPSGYSAFFAGNVYWSSGFPFLIHYQGSDYSSLSSWRSGTGNEQLASTTTGMNIDPLLSNAGTGIIISPAPTYSLNAYLPGIGSGAVNSGLDLSALFSINTGSTDFFTSALPLGNQRDVGACEKPALIITNVSEEMFGANKITFYPNPVNSGETLYFKGGEGPFVIELYNLGGGLITKKEQVQSEFNFHSGIPSNAIYIIRITDSRGKMETGKIVVR
jgi:hypothetical protein